MTNWRIATPLARQGTAVWHVDLSGCPPDSAVCGRYLSAEEHGRADRFLRRVDRDRFIRSHHALRIVLAGYLGRTPASLRFRSGPNGKPELDDAASAPLHFNLSHSAHHALIGISDGAAIGVDVEAIRPFDDPMGVARAHFHPGEIADLAGLSAERRASAFFACWTRKEAVAKALGTGLGLPLQSFRVSLPPADAVLLHWEGIQGPAPAWSMHHLDPEPDIVGAVAIARADEPCAHYRLAPNWTDAA